jgi:hypothetical protein
MPLPRTRVSWSERPTTADERLQAIEAALRGCGAVVTRGGDYDSWDLEVRNGGLGAARVRTLVEEHGGGRQFVRFKVSPRVPWIGAGAPTLLASLATGAALDGAWPPAFVLAAAGTAFILRLVLGCATAMAALLRAVEQPQAARSHRTATLLAAEETQA